MDDEFRKAWAEIPPLVRASVAVALARWADLRAGENDEHSEFEAKVGMDRRSRVSREFRRA